MIDIPVGLFGSQCSQIVEVNVSDSVRPGGNSAQSWGLPKCLVELTIGVASDGWDLGLRENVEERWD